MKAATLQSPPEWINRRYYEIQNTPIRVVRSRSIGYYVKEGLKAVLTLTAIYFLIVLLALL
ncbi:MAG: hypothetical protein ACLSW9_01635 [Megasphaera micronuciformis]